MVQQSRLRLLLAATFISIATAQSTLPTQITAAAPLPSSARSFPPCSANCLAAATGSLRCAESDSRCLCSHQDDVRSSVQACLLASSVCSAAEARAAEDYYPNVCKALGLDENGEPAIAVPTGGIATASVVNGLVPLSTGTPATAQSTSTPTTTSAPNSQSTSQEKSEDNGLPIATVAGIAVGATFVVVAIITGLIWMYIKRRDDDEEVVREIESQSKKPKPGFDDSTSSFKTPTSKTSEKTTEYALSPLPAQPKSQPPPKYTRSTKRSPADRRNHPAKPSLADRRNHPAKPLNRSPSETLNNSSYPFPFGDKSAAEASMTSLALPNSASKPVSAIIIQKSPARSQFSDQASIYSMSSIHSEEAQIQRLSDQRGPDRPNTFYNLYSGGTEGTSNTNLLPPQPNRPPGSQRRKKFNLQVSPALDSGEFAPPPGISKASANDRDRESINPFTTPPAKEPSNPFADTSATSSPPAKELRPNPLRSHPSVSRRKKSADQSTSQTQSNSTAPAMSSDKRKSLAKSGNSFGKFDFETDNDNADADGNGARRSSMALRESFLKSLDFGLENGWKK